MKFTKILIASAFFGTSFAAETGTATDAVETSAFKGNWTETFQTQLGEIIHTPGYICLNRGGIRIQTGSLNMAAGGNFNEYRLLERLVLNKDSTREEFVAALQRARIYNVIRTADPVVAAPAPAPKLSPKQARKARKAAARQPAPVVAPVAVAPRQGSPKILVKQAAAARKVAAKQAKEAKKASEAVRKAAAKQAAIAKKIAAKQAVLAKKMAAKQAAFAKKEVTKARKEADLARKRAVRGVRV